MHPWSCDTFAACPDATGMPATILAKNSDRPAGEVQPLRYLPRRSGGPDLRLAYLQIPDAPAAWAHVGASPYWCWGHELGLNEWGVAIGNEALFTRDLAASRSYGAEPGVLGMELVRLGLERSRTAEQAVDVVGGLVERYGQWGSGVPGVSRGHGAYDNSFLIADGAGAWVLETSGHDWVARQIRSGTWSISNQPTVRTDFDRASARLVPHAIQEDWWPSEREPFDFARAYADPQTPLQASHVRLQRSRQLLRDCGTVTPFAAWRILRDHYEDSFLGGPYFNAAIPDLLTLCMHEHPAGFTWGNTASSAVFVLPSDPDGRPYLWWCAGTPCTGVYLPVFPAAGGVPESLSRPLPQACCPENAAQAGFEPGSYWWCFLQLLDAAKGGPQAWDFADRQPLVRAALDPLERRWAADVVALQDAAPQELAAFTAACADEARRVARKLLADFGHDLSRPIDPRWAPRQP